MAYKSRLLFHLWYDTCFFCKRYRACLQALNKRIIGRKILYLGLDIIHLQLDGDIILCSVAVGM